MFSNISDSETNNKHTRTHGGVYFVFLRQEGFRQPPRKHFVIHGKFMENQSMENPWEIEWNNHGKTMEHSMGNPWKIHGKSMDNKNGKKDMFPWYSMGPHGGPWGPMGPHEESWVPMGSHGFPWVPWVPMGTPWVPMGPMGPHGTPWGPHGVPMGSPWVPMGPVLWVQFFGPSGHKIDTAI